MSDVVLLPGAPAGGSGVDRTRKSMENRSDATVRAGHVLMPHASGAGVTLHDSTRRPVGLAAIDIAPGYAGDVQGSGYLSLTDWTAATGAQGLTVGSAYWADPATAGGLTSTPPSGSGTAVQPLGVAVAADTIEINLAPRMRL